jgi:hypothetical protein
LLCNLVKIDWAVCVESRGRGAPSHLGCILSSYLIYTFVLQGVLSQLKHQGKMLKSSHKKYQQLLTRLRTLEALPLPAQR